MAKNNLDHVAEFSKTVARTRFLFTPPASKSGGLPAVLPEQTLPSTISYTGHMSVT